MLAVACTTLKGGRAEWLVEKATELGAFMLVPLVTERSQVGAGGLGLGAGGRKDVHTALGVWLRARTG